MQRKELENLIGKELVFVASMLLGRQQSYVAMKILEAGFKAAGLKLPDLDTIWPALEQHPY